MRRIYFEKLKVRDTASVRGGMTGGGGGGGSTLIATDHDNCDSHIVPSTTDTTKCVVTLINGRKSSGYNCLGFE
ncbi:MAG: hypothetical protein GY765_14010 [bacterium]|nr:hypothetical protein [bacterium]